MVLFLLTYLITECSSGPPVAEEGRQRVQPLRRALAFECCKIVFVCLKSWNRKQQSGAKERYKEKKLKNDKKGQFEKGFCPGSPNLF